MRATTTTATAEPAVELVRLFVYPWRPDHEEEAQQALCRFQAALGHRMSIELRYQGEGRNREALIVATNGTRRGPFRLTAAELERLAFSALCSALAQG